MFFMRQKGGRFLPRLVRLASPLCALRRVNQPARYITLKGNGYGCSANPRASFGMHHIIGIGHGVDRRPGTVGNTR